ncbi:MAG: SoxR reducing system RseC family protein [Alphaproteobacteria bacterium]
MNDTADTYVDASGRKVVEGIARVVALEGRTAWLEPEQTSACGGCKSAGVCGATGSTASRLLARRFPLDNTAGLTVGERIVVGTYEGTLLQASLIAYALPLLIMIGAAVTAQALTGSDGASAAGAIGGLAVGVGLARLGAGRLTARGELTPRFLRRAFNEGPGQDCHLD